MSRPSREYDKKLLEMGRKLLPKTGISGFSVRELCDKAGVNLGMFNYHFGTKDKYIEVLVSEIYREFMEGLTLEAGTGKTSLEKLRNALISVAFFIRDRRMEVFAFFEEVVRGNKELMGFAKKNMTAHVSVVLKLVAQCQKDGYVTKASIFSIAPVLIGALAVPNIAVRLLEKSYSSVFFGAAVPLIRNTILSDKLVIERVDLALKAITISGSMGAEK